MHHWSSIIIVLEFFLRRLAIFILVDGSSSAMFTDKFHMVDLLFVGLNACTLWVIPTWTSAFGLVIAHDPQRIRDCFAANAFILILNFRSFDFLLRFFFSLDFFLLSILNIFASILLFKVVEDNSLKIEWIEESPLGQWGYMLRINGSNLVCCISLYYDLAVLRNLSYFCMRTGDGLFHCITTSRKSS